ncbi:Complex I intermediate-associated protein 30 (CIA30) [Vreelandella subterranea]|uniref:Complex I intermediate-associated protein 30 (CIA30) n=1 Tax=Vreelandella subterranea TaxID=416874 RepID=A0A1H9U4D5_9GAMM|nr:CIA30 family protein [Halomonas subterranea]SES04182.1 Complex I intermediate-associated protein 30 (CIA30) [Halomonas subterranea]
MTLTFNDPSEQQRWYAVDDGVMGGQSRSQFSVVDGEGRFHGEVSLDNGGGFASVRREPHDFESTLADARGIALAVRGDGRTYQLRLKSTSLGDASAYRVKFTPATDSWETLHFSWAAFAAVRRGTLLTDAPSIKPADITQVGFLIADRTDGPFCLRVKYIESL